MNYQKQAEDFLSSTKTILTISYSGKRKHFADDTEKRATYLFRLINKKGTYTGRFGQSIAGTEEGKEPTAYDILACMTAYNIGSFADFCSGFGYDGDSRKAEKTYKAVQKEYFGLKAIFTEQQLEKLAEIQ